MPNSGEIKVHGLRELNRAFAKADKNLNKELRSTLKDVAEPVRSEASHRAIVEIRNIGLQWSEMRTGVTTKLVYVAPRQRRRGGSPRPNLANLLMERAMLPALEAHSDDIEKGVDKMLEELGRDWGNGPYG